MFPFDSLKTSENIGFPDVFTGVQSEYWEEMGPWAARLII